MATEPSIPQERNKALAKSTKPSSSYREDYIKTVNFIRMSFHGVSHQDNTSTCPYGN